MTALLHSVARLFAAAARRRTPVRARPATSLRARTGAALLLVGVSVGVWRLAFAGFGDGGGLAVPAGGGTSLLVSEFGLTADVLWSVPADDPGRREAVASVPHATGYGIFAALSPDGRRIAYTVLPPRLKAPSADSPADLTVLDLSTGEALVLAADADLLVTPVWAPDGRSVVFRRSQPVEDAAGSFQLVRAALNGGETVLADAGAALFPVGFAPDGDLLYTVLSPLGTDLARVDAGGGPPVDLGRLSDDFTRDWRLSPDGGRLAFLAPQSTAAGMVMRAMVARLPSGDGRAPLEVQAAVRGSTQDFGPAWRPTGDLTLGRLSPGQVRAPAVVLEGSGPQSLAAPERGFDVPVGWSPDGGILAVRTFEAPSPLSPGSVRLDLVEEDGTRRPVGLGGDVTAVGWLEND